VARRRTPNRSKDPELNELVSLLGADDPPSEQQRNAAALRLAGVALTHPCQPGHPGGCPHPHHPGDREQLRRVLDALGLLDPPEPEPEPATPPAAPPPPRPATSGGYDWTWTDRAACRRADLRLFFGPENERPADRKLREDAAKRICRTCPVTKNCLARAITHAEHGIWGASNEDERKTIRRRLARQRNQQTRELAS